jgi:hypothetical protein
MKIIYFIILILISSNSFSSELSTLDSPAELRWENRVILFGTSDSAAALAELKSRTAEVDDRDIVWVIFEDDEPLTNFVGTLSNSFLSNVQEEYSLDDQGGVLIGKDGGVKARFTELDLDRLFQTIDAMPMRQAEMKK